MTIRPLVTLTNSYHQNMRRRFWVITALLLLTLAILLPGIGLSEFALHRPPNHPRPGDDQFQVTRTAHDGVKLVADFTPTNKETTKHRCVVVLHGVASNRKDMPGMKRAFLDAGYNVLTPDSRAHGDSGGTHITYGLLESKDLQGWITDLTQRPECHAGIYAVGVSMGASVLIQTLATETRLRAAVAEAPFYSFHRIGLERVTQMLPWFSPLRQPIVSTGLAYIQLRYGLDLEQASPAAAAPRITTPVLLFHGTKDTNIVPSHSEALLPRFQRAKLHLVEGAGHAACFGHDRTAYMKLVEDWFAL